MAGWAAYKRIAPSGYSHRRASNELIRVARRTGRLQCDRATATRPYAATGTYSVALKWGNGAGDRIRTGDIDLGKVALYQLSYSRPTEKTIFARKHYRGQMALEITDKLHKIGCL